MTILASGAFGPDQPRRSQPVTTGHADVHQDHIGAQRPRLRGRLPPIARRPRDLDAVGLQQVGQPFQQEPMVVHEQHSHNPSSQVGRIGARSTTCVPAPGADWIVRRPPISAMRSAM